MDGVPVYLASLSRRHYLTGRLVFTPEWRAEMFRDGERMLRKLIGPMGDQTRERLFRMNVTLCLHRALTDEEIEALPSWFHDGEPEGIAGGPVEILKETAPGLPSTKPCVNPGKFRIPGYELHPHAWVPTDCGQCEPCRGRAEHGAVQGEDQRQLFRSMSYGRAY